MSKPPSTPSATYKPLAEFKEKQKPIQGEKGLYCGGKFVDIEDCARLYANPSGDKWRRANEGKKRLIPAAPPSGNYDVVIIGAGCVGGMVARELSRYKLKVLLVEKADDVTQGATKGNSGVIHAGYDDTPGSIRARFCPPGARMFSGLDEELHFGFLRTGSLVCAYSEADEAHLEELLLRGKKNGVDGLSIIRGETLSSLEPNLAPNVRAALRAEGAGIVTPYEFAIALCENAVDNGVELALRTEVTGIKKDGDSLSVQLHTHPSIPTSSNATPLNSTDSASLWDTHRPLLVVLIILVILLTSLLTDFLPQSFAVPLVAIVLGSLFVNRRGPEASSSLVSATVKTVTSPSDPSFAQKLQDERNAAALTPTTEVKAKFVVNCAGLFADKIANMVGDSSFTIEPRLGEYLLLHKSQGSKLVRHVLFPCPGPLGKGVLVQPTLWGNLILGPTARNLNDPSHMNQSKESIISYLLTQCMRLVPHFDPTQVIHSFAGARAKSSRGDWIVEFSAQTPNLLHLAGIDSPGLAGSPALGKAAVEMLRDAGLRLVKDPSFEPRRGAIVRAKNGWKNLKIAPTLAEAEEMADPSRAVICRCEKVTEGEIMDAIHRSLPCFSTQAVRKRTRAGMGHCQGERCGSLVQEIISRELSLPLSNVVRRPWPETSLLPQRWLTPEQQQRILELSKTSG